jgi:hypothetical protein
MVHAAAALFVACPGVSHVDAFLPLLQVPALQFGSVGMSLAHARLLDSTHGDAALAVALRANASAIFHDAVQFLWQDSDLGAWRCLYPEGNSTAVRSINDYVYISQASARTTAWPCKGCAGCM